MRMNLLLLFAYQSVLTAAFSGNTHSQVFAWRRSFVANTYTVGINPRNPNSVYAQGLNGFLYVSYDRGIRWNQRGNPGTSQIRQIIVHPSDTATIFVVAFGGGLRRSSDYGMTWNVVIANFGIDGESVTYDPVRPDTMAAGNYEDGKVYRSTDRGLTWTLAGTSGSDMCALAIRPDSANILYAGTGNGTISKSTDFGATWRQVKRSGSVEIPKIVIGRNNPMTGYAAAYAGPDSTTGVWKTTDGGEHWARTSLQGISVWPLEISESNPNVLYTGTFSDSRDAVYRTTNAGATWDTLKIGYPAGGNAWSLKVDPLDPSTVWLAINGPSQNGIYRWVATRARVNGVVRDAVTNDSVTIGSIRLLSTGETFQLNETRGHFSFDYFEGDSLLNPIAHVEAYPYYVRNEQISFVLDSVTTHDIRLQRLARASITGSVKTLTAQERVRTRIELFSSSFGYSYILASAFTDSNGMFQISDRYISYPPVVVYDSLYINPIFPYEQKVIRPIQLDSTGLVYHVRVDTADVLVVSTTVIDGLTFYNRFLGFYREALDSLQLKSHVWYRGGRGFAPGRRALEMRRKTAIYYTGSDSLQLYPEIHDSLLASINAGVRVFVTGQNFVEKNNSFAQNYFGVRHGGNTNQIFVRGNAAELFENMTMGTTGGTSANNQTSRDILLVENPRARSVMTYGLSGGFGTAAIRLDSVGAGGKLVLFGFGFEAINSASVRKTVMQKIISYFDSSIIVSVVENPYKNLPTEFRLEQNYPNPFNPSTNIRFQIPISSHVTLKVFDLLGRETATLVNEQLLAGRYTREWGGTEYASGVYFYLLSAGVFVETKKLVLLR